MASHNQVTLVINHSQTSSQLLVLTGTSWFILQLWSCFLTLLGLNMVVVVDITPNTNTIATSSCLN